jgi:PKD repeat protein
LALAMSFAASSAAVGQCPTAANCTPGTASSPNAVLFNLGIYRVTFGTINNVTSGYIDGYKDYSCTTGTSIVAGAPYSITIQTGSLSAENVRVWIDYDNNGILNATSELFFSSTGAMTHTGTNLRVPATAVLNTPLRMRVSSDATLATASITPCSTPQYGQVEDYAVTITSTTTRPTAAFTAGGDTLTCTGLVRFTDQSTNAPATWRWRFGDGTVSTLQNPQHQYAAQGIYSVTLTVTNAIGADSITKTRYIRYDTQVPVAASCTPQTVAYCCGYGITQVTFGSINRTSSNGIAGYEDFTCGSRASLIGGNSYPLTIATGTGTHDIRAWIDYDNNGQFSTSELVLTALGQVGATTQVRIPASAPLNTPLRMRIIADAPGQPGGTACTAPQNGQAEDYTVVVRANTVPPVAAFSVVAPASPCDTTRQFNDASQNAPTSWLWYFGDGTTSTLPSPQHTYRAAGTYTISLVVTNAFGTDSVALANAVQVVLPCRVYCVPTNLQTQSVWITRVQLANLDRSSQLDPGGYISITNPAANVTQNEPATVTVTTQITQGMGPPFFFTSVWIDYNQNGTWEAAEQVLNLQGNQNQPTLQQTFTIPNTALLGITSMRVLTTRNQQFSNNPCPQNGAPGLEIEDYLVVISPQQAPPVADFTVNNSVTCDGLVTFTDISSNAPSSWRWDFGDSSPSSTVRNPTHQYPTGSRSYTVKLVVRNAFGADSVTRTAAVTVTGFPVPVAAACQPASMTPGFGLGIDSVRLTAAGRILTNSTPDATDGYRDYSCSKQGVIFRNESATLRVRNIQRQGARAVAWIDFDNNGDFDPTGEQVMLSAVQTGAHVSTFIVPATAVVNTPLRMRVGTDWVNNPALTPCASPQYGQMEDYTVFIRDTVLATAAERMPLAVSVLPNPTVDGHLHVQLRGAVPGIADGAPLTLTVRSVLGNVVARRTLLVRPAASAELDLSELPRGVYILTTDGPTAALRGTMRFVRE